ncbi:hypothetical protein OQ257_11515 [Actinobacillus equuli subsp. equuli]|uniref:PEGA domain-containing protein n=1 Tax=Actinobacillus equuli subsp. equuli TaxID=202947 RepID=A0A9X4G908_ACTEU|nr:hypothetical protein [Actinobacillus equuli]MDE8035779.1 hypothetical protein [Actinobacillus equuli subsp. equuli]
MKKYLSILLASSTLIISGCATIMGDKTQTLPISSNPDGATYTITDEKGNVVQKGVTPSMITLEKSDGSYFGKKTYTLSFTKKGYKSVTYPLKTSPNGWYIGGNLVFGGLVGWLLVDPLNGGMYNINPDKVNVTLSE